MATPPEGELNLAALRPKGFLKLRLMFDGGWKWLTLLGAIFTLAGIGTIFVAKHFISLEKRYEREGRTVAGTVTNKDTYTTTSTSGSGRHRRTTTTTHYRVYYRFAAADGTGHSGKGNLSRGKWQALEPGGKIEVQYLPDEPAKNRPYGARHGKTIWFIVLFPVVFGGAGIAMLAIVGRRARKHAGLLANGTLTRGVVEEKAERHDITINNRHPYSITYTFALPDGEIHTGKDLVTDLRFAAKLTPGEPIGVIYAPAEPGKCTIFREKWTKYFQAAGI